MENLDRTLLYYINTLGSTPWLDPFFLSITDMHKSTYFAFIVIPFFLGLFIWKYGKRGIWIFLGLLFCLGLSDFTGSQIKKSVHRLRPGDAIGVEVTIRAPYGGYSFVSNHATNMYALATYSSFFIPPLTIPVFTIATFVAYSRIYNGVHYPSDVFFGALLGILFGYLCSQSLNYFLKVSLRKWY